MRLRYQTLRLIIREALDDRAESKAQHTLQTALEKASEYVDSLVAGKRDAKKADELKGVTEDIVSLARWLLSKREPRAEAFAQAAMFLKQVSDESSFWKTPAFLNKDQHIEKLQQAVRRAEKAAMYALKTRN